MRRAPARRLPAELRFGVGLAATTLLGVGLALIVWAVVPGAVPGWSTSVVESGSMSPLIREGDAVVVRPPPSQMLDRGTVILFDTGAGPTLHRVEQVENGRYVTRGDANGSNDSRRVTPAEVDGVGAILVPWVGQPRRWLADGRWGLLAVLVLVATVAVHTARWAADPGHDPWSPTRRPDPGGDTTHPDPHRPLFLGEPIGTTGRS